MNRIKVALFVLSLGTVFADEVESVSSGAMMTYSISLQDLLIKWGVSLGWIIVASIGFAFGVGLSIKVFDWLSVGIEEWEEVKNGNMVVGGILMTLIIMIGLIILKIL